MAPDINSPYPLYSTTFNTHRLSPLYHSSTASGNLTNLILSAHARHLRDILVGDVLRGVRIGLNESEDTLSRVGVLKSCQWVILKDEDEWLAQGDGDDTILDGDTMGLSTSHRGLHLEIVYEKATYTALMLREPGADPERDSPGFTNFPLLLTRMPASLRDTFLSFLSSTFDTLPQPLRMPEEFLTGTLERYIKDLVSDHEAVDADRILRSTLRDVLLTLSFDLPSQKPTLKTMDIQLSRVDLYRFYTRGQKLVTAQRRNGEEQQPFMKAVELYIQGHLALDVTNDRVRIAKVACGAFVLGADGRIKLFVQDVSDGDDDNEKVERAGRAVVDGLIRLAAGGQA